MFEFLQKNIFTISLRYDTTMYVNEVKRNVRLGIGEKTLIGGVVLSKVQFRENFKIIEK